MDKRFIVACILLIAVVAFFPTSEANPRFRRQASANASAGANASLPLQQLIDKLNSTLSNLLLRPGLSDQLAQPIQLLLAELSSGALTTTLQQLVDSNPLLPTLPIQKILQILAQSLDGNLKKLVNLVQTVVGLLLSPLGALLAVLGLPLQLLTGLLGSLGGGGSGASTLGLGSLLG